MNTHYPPYSLRAPQPADSTERKEAYAAIEAAFQAGDIEQAHRSLFTLLETDGKTPEFWLLLSWTAPDRHAAETFFNHLVRRHPNHPAVKEGVQWSGNEWGAKLQASAAGSGEAEKAEPATPVESIPPVRMKAVRIEPAAAPAEGRPTAGRTKEWWTPVGDRSAGGKEKVRWEPVNPADLGTSVPVSSREARWWSGAAPSADSAEAEVVAPEEPIEDSTPGSAEPRLQDRTWVWVKRLVEDLSQLHFAIALGLYLPIIALAEAAAAFINPYLGMGIHAALLVLILIYLLLKAVKGEKKFLLALGLAPLIRLISLPLPLMQFDFIYRTLIVGVPLLIAAAAIYRLSGYKPEQIGLTLGKHQSTQLVAGLAGLVLGFLEYLILRPQSLTESFGLGSILLLVLMLILAGFLEELVFRGLMQRASLRKLRIFGPLYVSLAFAVLHIGYKSWIDLVFAFLVGFAFSVIVEHTRSLVGVTLAHGLANISLFLIFPVLVGAQLRLPDFLPPPPDQIYGPVIWSEPLQQSPRPAPAAGDTPASPSPTATLSATQLPGSIVTNTPTSFPSPTSTLTPTTTPGYTATPLDNFPLLPTPTETRLPSASSTPTATLILPTPTETPIPTDILPEEPTPVPTDVLPIEPNATP
jgi:membrane protease YdiL (CAAX protease family)